MNLIVKMVALAAAKQVVLVPVKKIAQVIVTLIQQVNQSILKDGAESDMTFSLIFYLRYGN